MPLLRVCSPALQLAFDTGAPIWMAELFTFVLFDGITTYRWTSYTSDLTVGGHVYSSRAPWLERTDWNCVNTMEVPQMVVTLRALNDGFAGGANIKKQIANGLFDGATIDMSQVYGPTPGDTTTYGTIDGVFGGKTGAARVIGTRADITCKGKNNDLDQFAPRNIYQIGCLHAFCDPGCTLNRVTFTTAYTMGASGLTDQFIPWSGAPPGNYAQYTAGTFKATSGAASGQSRTIVEGTASGLMLIYPLDDVPSAGDAFTAFQGCDKTKDSGSGQSCTDYANTQHYRGFPYTPPPSSAT